MWSDAEALASQKASKIEHLQITKVMLKEKIKDMYKYNRYYKIPPWSLRPPRGAGSLSRTKLAVHGNKWELSPTGLNARRAVFFMGGYRRTHRGGGIVLRVTEPRL